MTRDSAADFWRSCSITETFLAAKPMFAVSISFSRSSNSGEVIVVRDHRCHFANVCVGSVLEPH
jgi:hypothetical protein